MAYHTPELLLVGTAHDRVLGPPKSQLGDYVNHDFDDGGYSRTGPPFDSASW